MELHMTMLDLRFYLVPLLLQRQHDACNRCKKPAIKYDVDHKVYNPMCTLNELQLLCIPCHKAITDYRIMKHRH